MRYGIALNTLWSIASKNDLPLNMLVNGLFDDIRSDGIQDGKDLFGPIQLKLLKLGPHTMISHLIMRFRMILYTWSNGSTLTSKDFWSWFESVYSLNTPVYQHTQKLTCPNPKVKIISPTEENPGIIIGGSIPWSNFQYELDTLRTVVVWICTSSRIGFIDEETFKKNCTNQSPFEGHSTALAGKSTEMGSSSGSDSYADFMFAHGAVWVKTDCGSEALAISNVNYTPWDK